MNRKDLLILAALLLSACSQSTSSSTETVGASADTTKTQAPEVADLNIYPVMHGSLVLEQNGTHIFVDPYGGPELYTSFEQPDIVVITHPHGDHLDEKTLKGLDLANAELIAPQVVIEKMSEDIAFAKVTVMANGETVNSHGIEVNAVPMYNLPETEESRHPKGWGNGYVLNIGGRRIYISGDTEDIQEMRNLKDIDVAFVCMNLPYTMGIDQAASAVVEFKPRVVYPYHYRNGNGTLSDVEQFKAMVNEKTDVTEVRLVNWYPKKG
ncbi:MAG: MBL fold metallo-hydrolase [Bacteroidetes bacterium]|jgi:L-ascorbate metabolism protein UlaG (beta-lactamase superfamily)|nr:MBL fold metallo-hydrolase [Bacteroidota bacterium]